MSVQAQLADESHPYVERRAGVHGGRPVVRGTRLPISTIVQRYHQGRSVEEILADFPQLGPAEVHDALSYFYDHRSEIEQELVELNDFDRATKEYPPTLRPQDRV